MTTRQYQIPGGPYVNVDETTAKQYQLPGGPYINVGGAAPGAPASFTTEPMMNNTETLLASESVVWTWFPGGRIGSLDAITAVDGSGTTGVDGTLTVTGLDAGSGILMVAMLNTDATDDYVYYEAGTVA